jgi:proteasome beta subunit
MSEELKKHVKKTGTTTIGIVCKDGIVLAADKRGTFASGGGVAYIAGTKEEKIQKINERMIVTIAGNASDLQKVIKLTRAELKLKELKSKRAPSIKESANLFSTIVYQNIRQFSPILGITHFLLAGYDEEEFALYNIFPDGYVNRIDDYSATGSGMMQSDAILDSGFKKGMSVQDGVVLAVNCINAAMKRDPGTGAGIDVYVVTKNKITHELGKEVKVEYLDPRASKKK